jgi:proline iminopeptidase
VIVLHGGPGVEHSYLLPEWRELETYSTVVFYDQRGCGKSADLPGPYTWEQHVADLEAVVREHARGRPVVLAGSSWGAHLALLYALEGEERIEGVILSGYTPWMGRYWARTWPTPAQPISRLDSLEQGFPVGSFQEPDTVSSGRSIGAYVADSIIYSRIVEPTNRRVSQEIYDFRSSIPPEKSLATIETPILIISGDRSGRVGDGSARLSAVVPGATRVVVLNAAHDAWAADPDAFFGVIKEFLENLQLLEVTEGGGGIQ